MGKILVVSANLGDFDPVKDNEEQSVNHHFHRFTDDNFPPREGAMTPRLQARICKMFSWQMVPGYDYYLWVDSSCRLSDKESIAWFMAFMEGNDIVAFKHPNRSTIKQEADYLKQRLKQGCPYITPRYKNELIDDQLREVDPYAPLYATTAFMYRNTPEVQRALKEWWYHTSRFHSIDQLSFTHATKGLKINTIPDSYLKVPYLEYVR